jgi:hypothetical protein
MARSRRDPGDACWQMLFGPFRPQTIRKIKKSQPPTEGVIGLRPTHGDEKR